MRTSRGASRGPFHPAIDNYPPQDSEIDEWLICTLYHGELAYGMTRVEAKRVLKRHYRDGSYHTGSVSRRPRPGRAMAEVDRCRPPRDPWPVFRSCG
ncbi:MAG: hypothetical protein ACLFR7_13110 [Opitutales bacterium]